MEITIHSKDLSCFPEGLKQQAKLARLPKKQRMCFFRSLTAFHSLTPYVRYLIASRFYPKAETINSVRTRVRSIKTPCDAVILETRSTMFPTGQ